MFRSKGEIMIPRMVDVQRITLSNAILRRCIGAIASVALQT
ncbi:MAG: hypothetical protein ACFE0I_23280 [Elainellaceae cyanobacterium]